MKEYYVHNVCELSEVPIAYAEGPTSFSYIKLPKRKKDIPIIVKFKNKLLQLQTGRAYKLTYVEEMIGIEEIGDSSLELFTDLG